jgi:hypothetical protein
MRYFISDLGDRTASDRFGEEKAALLVKIPNHCPSVEVIPPESGELPKAIFRRAVDGGEINIQGLIKDYEKFGLGDTLGYR